MKKTTLITLLFIPILAFSQVFQSNAPWMKNQLKKNGKLTINDISLSAEAFFNTIDRNKKGSGLKPFKRWEYHWSHYTKSDGTIAPATDLWNAWKQKNDLNATQSNNANDTSNWTSLGPYSHTNTASWSSGQGRVNVVTIDPSNSNTYYVGAPAGGIWKSTDAGINWQPLTDYLPQIGVSGIAVDPTDPKIIYIATGDDDANDSYAVGVMKTSNGGVTWNSAGNITANSMNDIFIDPNNTDILWVATNNGVYKSTNAGASWNLKLSQNVIDLKIKPGNTTTMYAATSSNVYRSTDSGESFNVVSITGFSGSRRIALAVTPANPNLVYFVSSKATSSTDNGFNGVYKSTNSGNSFVKTSETDDIFGGTQAWYDLAITVSDSDQNSVYVGVLNIWKSTDGANNFIKMNNWSSPNSDSYTHADIHFLSFINGKFFAGTDGGVYVSTNHGAKFTDLTENLAISQFYKISVASQNSGNIVGGLQDNGGYAYKDNKWSNYFGADGMDCAVNILNPDNYFGFIQYGGSLYETTDGGLTRKGSVGAPSAETGTNDSGGRWVTPMVSNSKGEIYAGYGQLYKLVNGNWVKVSNHIFGGDLYNIEIDPNNDNNIYVTRSDGFYKSIDAGKTFSKVALSLLTSINSIEVSNNDSNVAWVVVNSGIYKTSNLLSAIPTFTNITSNLPSESKLVVRHHPGHKDNRIYLGTSLGVYYIDDTLAQWQTFDNKLPNVAVRDIEINEKDSKLYAATYGRGVFMTDITKSLPTNDVKLVSVDSPINNSKSCGSVSPVITVKNQGSTAITSISVNYNIDGGSNSFFNWSGTLASEATTQITIPQFSLSKGAHVINIETTITNDSYSSNNSGSNSFNITELNATPTTVNSFETANDELLIETSGNLGANLWQRGAAIKTLLNATGSGNNAYITNIVGNYPDNTTSYLYTKCYDLSLITSPILSFKMAFDIELDWDHMYVEYTTDQGQNWAILGSASDPNWYNSSATTDTSGQSSLPGRQWTGEGEKTNPLGGTNATVHDYSYDLAAFTNEPNVMFRFKFIADQASNEEGVMIDDLVITGVLPVNEFDEIGGLSIYPNPSNSIFNINWAQGNDFSISVFDLTGKLLLQEKSDANSLRKFSLDMSKFGKGIYFAKIKVDEKQSTKKLILK